TVGGEHRPEETHAHLRTPVVVRVRGESARRREKKGEGQGEEANAHPASCPRALLEPPSRHSAPDVSLILRQFWHSRTHAVDGHRVGAYCFTRDQWGGAWTG